MTTNTMYVDFIKAQKEFERATKESVNPFHKSKYADLSVCIDAVKGALNNNNFALIQKTHDYENGVCVETVLLHSSGEFISGGILKVPSIKQDPQAYGSSLTYARRYSLMAVCGIAPEDDDGNSTITSNASIHKPMLDTKIDKLKEAQRESKQKSFKEEKDKLTEEAIKQASMSRKDLEIWWKSLNDHQRSLMRNEMTNINKFCPEGVSE